ncbi:MAG TPA: hypothetical protein DEA73_00650 [Peptococcaceae bacterium]|nr:MAG: hypothetical protein XD51_1133 [Moorella sp. 60_41]HBT46382.1 hypothetical protein [Peptococcaceae bacterium]
MAANLVEELYNAIKRLPSDLKKELYTRLGVIEDKKTTAALDELIGIASGPKGKGSRTYKEDLYGGSRPL